MNNKEFITRAVTGIFIVAVTLFAILYSPYTFLAFITMICMIGTWEFFKLDLVPPRPPGLNLLPVLFGLIISCTGIYLARGLNPMIIVPLVPAVLSFTMLVQLFSLKTPAEFVRRGKSVYTATAYIVLPLLAGTAFLYGKYDSLYVLVPALLIWVNDVGAYVFGSRWGTTKITPQISPGKSMQGVIGGAFVTCIMAFIIWRLWPDIRLEYLLTLAISTPFISLAGDLWKSALKRNAGVKDSGHLLPGHGGILDRYDSFIFLLPVAALTYYIFA